MLNNILYISLNKSIDFHIDQDPNLRYTEDTFTTLYLSMTN